MTTAAEPTTAHDRAGAPASASADWSPTPAAARPRQYDRHWNEPREGTGLARALGWFSIGLGTAELVAPGRLARLVGVRDPDDRSRRIVQAMGLREIATGMAILAQPGEARWLGARVAGDVVDLALLGSVARADGSRPGRTAAAAAAVAGVAALDILGTRRLRENDGRGETVVHVRRTMTINRSPDEVYRFWHDFQNLPRFMRHLESVETLGGGRSRWRARAPGGRTVEWEAEITADRPGELIAWRSVEGDVDNAGSVHFSEAPGNRGTEVRVELRYAPPAGRVGQAVAMLFGREPSQQVEGDLRRFKQVMETGEVVRSDASIHRGPHPAQPPAREGGRS